MTSLNISLPEALKEYVERQVATGDWGTPSEYVRELIRQDKERHRWQKAVMTAISYLLTDPPRARCANSDRQHFAT
jgi:antitoxin ParD1/3/4